MFRFFRVVLFLDPDEGSASMLDALMTVVIPFVYLQYYRVTAVEGRLLGQGQPGRPVLIRFVYFFGLGLVDVRCRPKPHTAAVALHLPPAWGEMCWNNCTLTLGCTLDLGLTAWTNLHLTKFCLYARVLSRILHT